MEVTFDLEEEARAAEELVRNLEKIDAPRVLIEQARQRANELGEDAKRHSGRDFLKQSAKLISVH